MRCDNCGRVATYHSIEIINGNRVEQHLCSDCAANLREEMEFMPLTIPTIGEFFDFPLSFKPPRRTKQILRCPKCGCTSEDFIKNGKLGCNECYKYLKEVVDPAIEEVLSVNDMPDKISLNNEGINKDIPLATDLKSLNEQLKVAVKEERFEDASHLKAQIDKLKQSGQQNV